MHLIPDTWPHFHLLVSVFPSVGLIFAIGLFIGAMVAKNSQMQRVGLFVFGGLAVLGVPTMFSGIWSEPVLTRPGLPEDVGAAHLLWSYFALGFLWVTGVLALWVLWRTFKTGTGPSRNMQHLVLGLSLFTLLNMMIVGDMGWKISHQELKIPFVYGNTSQVWSHINIILNHFPTVGFVVGLFFFICGLVMKNVVMERSALVVFVACAVLGATTYVTGASAMWALTSPPIPAPLGPISQARINAHRDFALLTLFGLAFTGVTAWMEIYRYRYQKRFSQAALYLVLGFAVITLLIMAETGHRGGLINHPEIRTAGDAMTQDAATFLSPQIEIWINNIIYFVPWQTVHFFGYTAVFATVLVVSLRIFGVWKSMPFSAVHRIIPLGVFGVAANVFTGMLMLMADTSRYVNEAAFWPKMFFLPIGAIAVLYFSLSDRLWATKAGEEAPMDAKWIAAVVLFSWTIVIMGGRLLPYLFV
ncbi:MAG: DUF2231 domain-containing protein [Caulobacteraceae bacterium]